MKKTAILFSAILLNLISFSAAAQELVIRIDDMGALHSVNEASIDTYKNGIATSVEVLVVGPWFPEAVLPLMRQALWLRWWEQVLHRRPQGREACRGKAARK